MATRESDVMEGDFFPVELGPGLMAEITVYTCPTTKKNKYAVSLVFSGDSSDADIYTNGDISEVVVHPTAMDPEWHEKLAKLFLKDLGVSP